MSSDGPSFHTRAVRTSCYGMIVLMSAHGSFTQEFSVGVFFTSLFSRECFRFGVISCGISFPKLYIREKESRRRVSGESIPLSQKQHKKKNTSTLVYHQLHPSFQRPSSPSVHGMTVCNGSRPIKRPAKYSAPKTPMPWKIIRTCQADRPPQTNNTTAVSRQQRQETPRVHFHFQTQVAQQCTQSTH